MDHLKDPILSSVCVCVWALILATSPWAGLGPGASSQRMVLVCCAPRPSAGVQRPIPGMQTCLWRIIREKGLGDDHIQEERCRGQAISSWMVGDNDACHPCSMSTWGMVKLKQRTEVTWAAEAEFSPSSGAESCPLAAWFAIGLPGNPPDCFFLRCFKKTCFFAILNAKSGSETAFPIYNI